MPEKKPFHVAGLEPMKMKVLGVNIFPLVAKVAVVMMMLMMMMARVMMMVMMQMKMITVVNDDDGECD